MYPIERLRDIRELELYLFGGVPEVPEPMFERDIYTHSEIRTTRDPVVEHSTGGNKEETVVGYMEVDLETGEVSFREFEEST